jgi:signal transduction histidine kinase
VQTIQKVAVQLDTVIKDLNSILSLKKDIQEDLALISLAELLENVKEFVRSDIEKSGAIIQIDVSRTPEILAISSYAHSIFTNFLTNAIKYKHPNREPIIKITSIVTDKYIRIDITDNGIGMDIEKVKSRLFSPFSRFHASTKIEGKGLGLFLVKSQIEAIGGKIEVHSETEIGTTFFIYFPIHS